MPKGRPQDYRIKGKPSSGLKPGVKKPMKGGKKK